MFSIYFLFPIILCNQIRASSVISMLQSDIKSALKSAFGKLDGPLSVIDWCRGRSLSRDGGTAFDGSFAESVISECKDSSSTVGEPMSPAQSSAGASSFLKGLLFLYFPGFGKFGKLTFSMLAADGAKADDGGKRRLSQEAESEKLRRPLLSVLPSPAILVGY